MAPAFRNLRAGFILPLALFALTLIAMLAAVLLEGALQELRIARGDVAAARAQAAAGTTLAGFLSSAADSATLARPRGTAVSAISVSGAETTTVTVQSLGNGLLRVTAGARVWSGMQRGDAANFGFVRITRDSAGPPGSLRYRRLPDWWWGQLP